MGVPPQLHPQHDAPPPDPDPQENINEEGMSAPTYQEPHGWSPYVQQTPFYGDQPSNDWGYGWDQNEGTSFMSLLVGPSTSEYGAGTSGYGCDLPMYDMGGLEQSSMQDLNYATHYQHGEGATQPCTQDPGDLTQEQGADDQEQPAQHSTNFFARMSGLHYVRRSRRENRGKRRDPVYRT